MSEVYSQVSARYGYPSSERLIKVLRRLMSEDDAALTLDLPAQNSDLAAKTGRSEEQIQRSLDRLYQLGVLSLTSKGYRLSRDIVTLHDGTSSDVRSDSIWGTELLDLWRDFSENELSPDMGKSLAERTSPIFRVIPVREAIEAGAIVLPCEDLDVILNEAARFSLVNCPCRRIARKCDRPTEVCLQMGKAADYSIKRGTGREVTREEAKEALALAAGAGLVHNVPYKREVGELICNCCSDCCMFLGVFVDYNILEKGMSKSRFGAKVDQVSCSGCQDCIEQCQFNALNMVKLPGEKKLKARVDPERCYGCGVCASSCQTDSIKLYEVRPPDHIPA